MSVGGGIGQMAGGIAGMFSKKPKYNDPSKKANQYLDKIPGQIAPYLNPYIQQGQQAGNQLMPQFSQMFGNSGEFYNKLGEGYQQSPGYQFKLNQALQAGGNASAAGGMLGSPQHQEQAMGTANGIASQDFNDYMKNVLGVLGMGQEGLQGFEQQGFGASGDFASALAAMLGQQSANAYQGEAGKNQFNTNQAMQKQKNWADIFGGAGNAAGSFIAGGGF